MLLYKIINPIVKALLASPVHGLMSDNTVVLYTRGRKTGRAYSTPVSYMQESKVLHCFTARTSPWWRNVAAMAKIEVLLQGQRRTATPAVILDDDARKNEVLTRFLRAVPRDAAFSGVTMLSSGEPDGDDIARVVSNMVLVELHLSEDSSE
ncbi:MAG: nitroreductase family deazaflavin-dependent oxidoreductase [Halieaceae bacterium]|nr:nitroreductase family deazaflavin-dependent oxidoreductase [Halieaceae bacterium]